MYREKISAVVSSPRMLRDVDLPIANPEPVIAVKWDLGEILECTRGDQLLLVGSWLGLRLMIASAALVATNSLWVLLLKFLLALAFF